MLIFHGCITMCLLLFRNHAPFAFETIITRINKHIRLFDGYIEYMGGNAYVSRGTEVRQLGIYSILFVFFYLNVTVAISRQRHNGPEINA
jgi:hypothetical protein